MTKYYVQCSDGTDSRCTGEGYVEIDEAGLSSKEVDAYIEEHGLDIELCGFCGSDSLSGSSEE